VAVSLCSKAMITKDVKGSHRKSLEDYFGQKSRRFSSLPAGAFVKGFLSGCMPTCNLRDHNVLNIVASAVNFAATGRTRRVEALCASPPTLSFVSTYMVGL
jgi:hypothetical protein